MDELELGRAAGEILVRGLQVWDREKGRGWRYRGTYLYLIKEPESISVPSFHRLERSKHCESGEWRGSNHSTYVYVYVSLD